MNRTHLAVELLRETKSRHRGGGLSLNSLERREIGTEELRAEIGA